MYEEILNKNPFILSDFHMGHKNIIKYAGRKDNWEEILIKNYNNVVKDSDVVLILGDFALAGKEETEYYASLFKGIKYLLKGNHDERSSSFYSSIGLNLIKEKQIEYKNVILSHRPIENLPPLTWNIHGHIHEKMIPDIYHINACVEVFNYTPKRLKNIMKNLEKIR